MKEGGQLPVYYPGDAEIYLRAGIWKGKLICTVTNIGLDNLDSIDLVIEKEPSAIKKLTADGEFSDAVFETSDGITKVFAKCEILHPVILLIE